MCTHPHESDITTTCLQSVLRGTHSMRCWGGEESQPMILLCSNLNTILIIPLLQFTIRTWPLICAAVQANGGIERAVLDAYCWMYSSWNIPQEYKGACTGGDQVRQGGLITMRKPVPEWIYSGTEWICSGPEWKHSFFWFFCSFGFSKFQYLFRNVFIPVRNIFILFWNGFIPFWNVFIRVQVFS